ncbi:TPA: hypothetical protein QDB24_002294 [Burkholderia vietnamiensis]|uniref:hypothetical protein n=1 Tax=Burkholderia vietnamiensis TaxID=60552 RepID=UPI00075A9853|nr:hypothetical protein [Burkholderia vietnamiensis]KVE06466.1 hypothetical protein WI91_09075 [Burkholderia vietnamiensis]KVE80384.1 hypothetical protein WJ00_02360 [Burkholderia vietnamiensis]MBR7910030.1 hypothetical protein [Burkholderia vietnamiensis]MCA7943247.1 hypothetical protein [Burkholderia vietnamiensis]HDR9274230.1 hypothetical protein [Burkholderia vietnamiensis]
MNCKPGDLAIVTRGARTVIEKKVLGRIVRVTTADEQAVWTIEEPIWLWHAGRSYKITGICDECLTPLRGEPEIEHEQRRDEVTA